MGAERAAQIAEMESMGFERSQIDLAMRAAYYNSERAIEYLLTVRHTQPSVLAVTLIMIFREFRNIFYKNTDNPNLKLPLHHPHQEAQVRAARNP